MGQALRRDKLRSDRAEWKLESMPGRKKGHSYRCGGGNDARIFRAQRRQTWLWVAIGH